MQVLAVGNAAITPGGTTAATSSPVTSKRVLGSRGVDGAMGLSGAGGRGETIASIMH